MADRVVRAIITGSSVGAVRAFEETAVAADAAGNNAAKSMEASAARQGNAWSALGGTLGKVAVGIGVGFIAVAGAAVDLASKYASATDSMAAHAGISAAAAQKIGDAFLTTGGQTTFSAQQMMQAFAPVAGQLGLLQGHALDAAQALSVMRAASDLAEASGTDLNTATAALAKTMQAFQEPVTAAAAVSNILFNAARDTGVGVDTLTEALSRARARMGAAAPALQDMGGLLVDLAAHGETGRAAMSALGSAFTGIITPTAAVQHAQEAMGLSFINARTGALLPLTSILAELQPKLAGLSSVQAEATLQSLGFGAASAKLAETFQAGPAVLQGYIDSIGKTGSAHGAAQTATDNLKGAFDRMKSSVLDAGISLGQKLTPAITGVMTWIASVMPTAVKTLGTLFDWIGKNVIPPLTVIFKILSDTLGFLVSHLNVIGPIILVVAGAFVAWSAALAIQGLIQGVSMALYMFQAGLAGVAAAEVGGTSASFAFGAALDFALGPIGLIILGVAAVAAAVILLVTHFNQVRDVVIGVWNTIGDHIGGAVNVIIAIFKVTPFGFLLTHLSNLRDFFVNVFGVIASVVRVGVGVVEAIVNRLGVIFGVVADVIGAVVNRIGVVIALVGDVVGPVVAGIGAAFGVAVSVVADAVGVIVAIIGGLVDAISVAVTVIANIWGVLSTILSVVFRVAVTLIEVPLALIVGAVQLAVTAISAVIRFLVPAFAATFNAIRTVVQVAIHAIEMIVRALAIPIGLVIRGIVTVFTVEFNIIRTVITAVIHTIQAVIGALAGPVGVVVKAITSVFTVEFNIIKTVVTTVIGIIANVIGALVGIVSTVVGAVLTVFQAVAGPIAAVFRGIVSVVSGIIGGLSDAFRTVVGGFAAIIGAVAGPVGAAIRVVIGVAKGIIDAVIGAINFVIGIIDAIQVHIHFGPVSLDWNGLNIPKIPQLQTGGVVTHAGLAWLHPAEIVVAKDQQMAAGSAVSAAPLSAYLAAFRGAGGIAGTAGGLGVQKVWIAGSDVPLGFVSALAAAAPLMAILAVQLNTVSTLMASGNTGTRFGPTLPAPQSGAAIGGGLQHGGVSDFGAGTLMLLHGIEAVIPQTMAPTWLWSGILSVLGGGTPASPVVSPLGSATLPPATAPAVPSSAATVISTVLLLSTYLNRVQNEWARTAINSASVAVQTSSLVAPVSNIAQSWREWNISALQLPRVTAAMAAAMQPLPERVAPISNSLVVGSTMLHSLVSSLSAPVSTTINALTNLAPTLHNLVTVAIPRLTPTPITPPPPLSAPLAVASRPVAYPPLAASSSTVTTAQTGPTSVTINVYGGDPNAVVKALRQYVVSNGAIPVTVRSAQRMAG